LTIFSQRSEHRSLDDGLNWTRKFWAAETDELVTVPNHFHGFVVSSCSRRPVCRPWTEGTRNALLSFRVEPA